MRLLYWTGMFVLMALVTHLAYVLFAPRLGARAWMREVTERLDENRLHMLSSDLLRRVVRHPTDTTVYAACLMALAERDVILRGGALRGLWMLTVHAPSGDVIYTISDRHLPPGPLHVRFQLARVDAGKGEIALPRLEGRTMVVPLAASRALMLLEAWPWHPGQRDVLRAQVAGLQCVPAARARVPRATPDTAATAASSANTVRPRPRSAR